MQEAAVEVPEHLLVHRNVPPDQNLVPQRVLALHQNHLHDPVPLPVPNPDLVPQQDRVKANLKVDRLPDRNPDPHPGLDLLLDPDHHLDLALIQDRDLDRHQLPNPVRVQDQDPVLNQAENQIVNRFKTITIFLECNGEVVLKKNMYGESFFVNPNKIPFFFILSLNKTRVISYIILIGLM